MRSDAGGNACCNGVVSSKNQWEEALAQRLLGGLGNVETGFRDLLQVFCTLLANRHFLRLLHFKVADVFYRVAKLFDGRLQTGAPQSGGPHVHAAAGLAEVHGHTNDANFLWHCAIQIRRSDSLPSWGRPTLAPRRSAANHSYLRGRLRIHPVNHAREGDDLSDVLGAANPGYRALKP